MNNILTAPSKHRIGIPPGFIFSYAYAFTVFNCRTYAYQLNSLNPVELSTSMNIQLEDDRKLDFTQKSIYIK